MKIIIKIKQFICVDNKKNYLKHQPWMKTTFFLYIVTIRTSYQNNTTEHDFLHIFSVHRSHINYNIFKCIIVYASVFLFRATDNLVFFHRVFSVLIIFGTCVLTDVALHLIFLPNLRAFFPDWHFYLCRRFSTFSNLENININRIEMRKIIDFITREIFGFRCVFFRLKSSRK